MSDPGELYIRFLATVDANSIAGLMAAVDDGLRRSVRRFVILVSSPGGTVFHGLSAYNFLAGIPAEVETHNFGSVDSIGVVLFCAGSKRYSVPHARFLLHGVQANFPQGASLEEMQLEERLKGLRIDLENIAGVIAGTVQKPEDAIVKAMLDRTTLSPEQAMDFGLVHEIRTELMPDGASFVTIP